MNAEMAQIGSESPKVGLDRSKVGRKKGTPNKTTKLLKDATLMAATRAGDKGGLVGFLEAQARKDNNAPFMSLLGKVLPMQLAGDPDNPLQLISRIERVIVQPSAAEGE